mmetsp:Transcript_43441/g.68028  ORF Transcript_43441/g.68028 Transcript_43441/m.68028 type:complete len:91 (-) Transcript_43441:116-388(-)
MQSKQPRRLLQGNLLPQRRTTEQRWGPGTSSITFTLNSTLKHNALKHTVPILFGWQTETEPLGSEFIVALQGLWTVKLFGCSAESQSPHT